MSRPAIIIIGAGGHAIVVADALLSQGREVLGFVDANQALHGGRLLGLPVLGDDSALATHAGDSVELANGIGGTGTLGSVVRGTIRRAVQERLETQGWRFAPVLHPRAVVSPYATIEPGSQVLAGAVVQAMSHVGRGAIVNTGAIVEHHCEVGAFVHLAPGCTLCGNVCIGEEAHIGAGAVVRQGVRIASRVVVAMGAAVTRTVESGAVAGVPARPFGMSS
ncbi:acetyltransferase [Piscinibacter terrae]|nr:acetyltransferase [Albitalea terrae]